MKTYTKTEALQQIAILARSAYADVPATSSHRTTKKFDANMQAIEILNDDHVKSAEISQYLRPHYYVPNGSRANMVHLIAEGMLAEERAAAPKVTFDSGFSVNEMLDAMKVGA